MLPPVTSSPAVACSSTASSDRPDAIRPLEPNANLGTAHQAADDLARQTYCVLGLPIDAVDVPEVLERIETAAAGTAPLLVSTVNVNYLAFCQTDPAFRDTVLLSDLCVIDGMPVVLIARLMGLPVRRRIAGSDLFATLRSRPSANLKVFLMGGDEGVAEAAARAINRRADRMRCVGAVYPGFGSVDEMSGAETIDQINASGANFLVLSLGAQKAHHWLLHNHERLRVPIRAHLGAVINFEAGTVKRAPRRVAQLGLEWLWRIKEEPRLWRRYWRDGRVLLRLVLTRAIPVAVAARLQQLRPASGQELNVARTESETAVTLSLAGDATAPSVGTATAAFRAALDSQKQLLVDLSATRRIDCRFFGLLLMLRKQLKGSGRRLVLTGISPQTARLFRRNGVAFLLSQ